MSVLVAATLGAGVGIGALLIFGGLSGRTLVRLPNWRPPSGWTAGPTLIRVAVTVAAGLMLWAITGWPAAAVLVVVAAATGPRLVGGKADREAAIAKTDAIAAWTEMLRDTMVAASGLEHAIDATVPVAPAPIRDAVGKLAAQVHSNTTLVHALADFGDTVDQSSADLVVAALSIGASGEGADLAPVLTRLAEATRDEARMRARVEAGRAQVRTSTRVILSVLAGMVVLLAVMSRGYLDAYDSARGQVVLILIGGLFAVGAWLLHRMAQLELPRRFSARRASGGAA